LGESYDFEHEGWLAGFELTSITAVDARAQQDPDSLSVQWISEAPNRPFDDSVFLEGPFETPQIAPEWANKVFDIKGLMVPDGANLPSLGDPRPGVFDSSASLKFAEVVERTDAARFAQKLDAVASHQRRQGTATLSEFSCGQHLHQLSSSTLRRWRAPAVRSGGHRYRPATPV
jgi:hypothetical protein